MLIFHQRARPDEADLLRADNEPEATPSLRYGWQGLDSDEFMFSLHDRHEQRARSRGAVCCNPRFDSEAIEFRVASELFAAAMELTTRTLRSRLAPLVDQGLVIAIGKNARDPHRKYHWNISA